MEHNAKVIALLTSAKDQTIDGPTPQLGEKVEHMERAMSILAGRWKYRRAGAPGQRCSSCHKSTFLNTSLVCVRAQFEQFADGFRVRTNFKRNR